MVLYGPRFAADQQAVPQRNDAAAGKRAPAPQRVADDGAVQPAPGAPNADHSRHRRSSSDSGPARAGRQPPGRAQAPPDQAARNRPGAATRRRRASGRRLLQGQHGHGRGARPSRPATARSGRPRPAPAVAPGRGYGRNGYPGSTHRRPNPGPPATRLAASRARGTDNSGRSTRMPPRSAIGGIAASPSVPLARLSRRTNVSAWSPRWWPNNKCSTPCRRHQASSKS